MTQKYKNFTSVLELIKSLPTETMTTDEILKEVQKYFPDHIPLPPDEWFAKP
jgi:hypothetical protein